MIVCHCHGVNDRTIAEVVDGGALDVDEVARACRAGSDCGGCVERLEAIVDDMVGRFARAS